MLVDYIVLKALLLPWSTCKLSYFHTVAVCINKASRQKLFIVSVVIPVTVFPRCSVFLCSISPMRTFVCYGTFSNLFFLRNLAPHVRFWDAKKFGCGWVASTAFCNCDHFALQDYCILNMSDCHDYPEKTQKTLRQFRTYATRPCGGSRVSKFCLPFVSAAGRAIDYSKNSFEGFTLQLQILHSKCKTRKAMEQEWGDGQWLVSASETKV